MCFAFRTQQLQVRPFHEAELIELFQKTWSSEKSITLICLELSSPSHFDLLIYCPQPQLIPTSVVFPTKNSYLNKPQFMEQAMICLYTVIWKHYFRLCGWQFLKCLIKANLKMIMIAIWWSRIDRDRNKIHWLQ